MTRLAMTLDEIAEVSGISRTTIRRAITAGALPRVPHTGARIIVPTRAVEAWLSCTPTNEEGRQQFAPADGLNPDHGRNP